LTSDNNIKRVHDAIKLLCIWSLMPKKEHGSP